MKGALSANVGNKEVTMTDFLYEVAVVLSFMFIGSFVVILSGTLLLLILAAIVQFWKIIVPFVLIAVIIALVT